MLSIGAEGESRTPTPLPELDPEPSVSTNSTTSARKCVYRIRPLLASFFFRFSPFFMGAHKSTMFWKDPAGRHAEGGRAGSCGTPRHGRRPARRMAVAEPEAPGWRRLLWRCDAGTGWQAARQGGRSFPPLAQAAVFSQTGSPAEAGKTARIPHAPHCPPDLPARVFPPPPCTARARARLSPLPVPDTAGAGPSPLPARQSADDGRTDTAPLRTHRSMAMHGTRETIFFMRQVPPLTS